MGPTESRFTIMGAAQMAEWMEDVYEGYLDHLANGGAKEEISGKISNDWDAGLAIRVSKIASACPKRNAAEAKGKLEKPKFSINKKVLFEDAKRAAEVVYEALTWGSRHTNLNMSVDTEVRTLPQTHWTGLVGTTDAIISLWSSAGYTSPRLLPIEVKRSDSDKWFGTPKGITQDQVTQAIGEMILAGKEKYGDCAFGFVFARYGTVTDDEWERYQKPLCKVWTVAWSEDYQGWFLYDKLKEVDAPADSEWPTLPDGRIYISLQSYLDLHEQHKEYMFSESPIDEPAPYPFLENWRCAKVKKTEFYSENGANKGRKKDGTGVVKPRCPLFDLCYAKELAKAGYEYQLNTIDEYDLELLRVE